MLAGVPLSSWRRTNRIDQVMAMPAMLAGMCVELDMGPRDCMLVPRFAKL